jgi:beta-alanine--pyruvate transaminase
MMSLKGPGVLDIRCVGLTCGIDLASRPDAAGKRGFEAMERGFHDEDIMFRIVGDSIAFSPPLIVSESEIGQMVDKVGRVIKAVA